MEKIYRHRFPTELILATVRWYLRYNLSYRNLSEMLLERGIGVSYESIRQWVQKFAPKFDGVRRAKKSYYTLSWRMDETYIKVKGVWYYYYRAIDSHGQVIDFYLSKRRNTDAAKHFLKKVIRTAGSTPNTIVSDKALAYYPAIASE